MVNRSPGYLIARRAVEALRSGVPNREAVRELGCRQPRVEQRFVRMLEEVPAGRDSVRDADPDRRGMLVSGDFGVGKSHLLEYLEHLALSRNFVCSRVAVSKETPLYDLGKVFSSAMDNGCMPDRTGRFVEELSFALRQNAEKFGAFAQWADRAADEGLISPVFPASVQVYQDSDDFELQGDIESFWAGDKLQIAKLRAGLREIGKATAYRFRAPRAADLPLQRLRFAVELIRAVGYRGWVVLLDEIELMGSYSILQRGRSYAEITGWMGCADGDFHPGLIGIGAVTGDFASAIISRDGQKKDRDHVRTRLERSARHAGLADRAEYGMNLLEQRSVALEVPDEDDVRGTLENLRGLYRRAYDWEPPAYEAAPGGVGFQGRMRYKVRAAINEWDLRRLCRLRPHDPPDTEIEGFDPGYEEDPELG